MFTIFIWRIFARSTFLIYVCLLSDIIINFAAFIVAGYIISFPYIYVVYVTLNTFFCFIRFRECVAKICFNNYPINKVEHLLELSGKQRDAREKERRGFDFMVIHIGCVYLDITPLCLSCVWQRTHCSINLITNINKDDCQSVSKHYYFVSLYCNIAIINTMGEQKTGKTLSFIF